MKYVLLLFAVISISAQPADPWKPLQILMGEWVGETAESAGACSFTFDLERRVLVRRSYSQSAASRHEDLMVVYVENDLKAIYFDSENHVIRYTVESGPDWVRFLSDQYRLTYRKNSDKLSMDFDIAPPGKPFSNYLHANLRKK
jgi:hypothetical protein